VTVERKIFIDCGANNGCSTRFWRDKYANGEDYEYHCFEPNLNFSNDLKKIENINIYKQAVWVKDGSAIFYHVSKDRYGNQSGKTGAGTLNEAKSTWNKKVHQTVDEVEIDTIDLSRWVKENFKETDHIILKMDIEGSEYEVLYHLINTDTMKYFNRIYCELHGLKCGKTKTDTESLIFACLNEGHKLYEWDALGY